ncbi:hypothetical protein [Alsobacter sp. R-9]
MIHEADPSAIVPAAPVADAGRWARRLLWGGALVLTVAAGLVLWSSRGAAVFVDMVSAAVAWCL